MTLLTVLAEIEEELPHYRDRDAFASFGERAIRRAGLTAADATAAHERLSELTKTISIHLPTKKDRDDATSLCQIAAERLTAAPWYRTVTETWPAPIAHEVVALVACLTGEGRLQPSPEAALLQLRDLSETLLKLPASILARRLIVRGGTAADEMRRALGKVRGGEWNDLARKAAERLAKAEPGGKLAGLAALFEPASRYTQLLGRLTTARNDAIGHGALRSNPADTAAFVSWFVAGQERDPQPSGHAGKIAFGVTIAKGLEDAAAAQPWQGLRLEAEGEDGPIDLTGTAALRRWHQDERHRHHADRTLPLWLTIAGEEPLRLSPLLGARICRECGRRDVFFFDTIYDRKPWKVDFLDYGRGHKSRLNRDAAADLLDELRPEPPGLDESTGDSLYERSAIEALDAMRVDRRYRSPTYLREPFTAFLKAHDRGIYWLQAPAHIGKTMFTLGLTTTELGDEPIAPGLNPGAGIAAFFCKREYREGRITFLNALGDSLKVVLNLGNQSQFPYAEQVTGASDPRAAFVAWLQAWRTLARPRDQRLLVVIDGLDETDPPGPNSLLSLLPPAELLPEGLHLLLTSRPLTDKDCPAWLGSVLAPLVAGAHAQTRILGLGDEGYRALMTGYARDRLGLNASPVSIKTIDAMIDRAEGRFVFFSFLVEQRRFGDADDGIARGTMLYESFLDGLEPRYGTKRAEGLISVLAALTATELAHGWVFGLGAVRDEATGGILEPMPRDFPGLELETLAAIVDMDEMAPEGRRLSVMFVEALLLLQGTLWVRRGGGGAPRYRLGLKEFAAVLEQRQPQALARARTRLAASCLDAVDLMASALKAGETPDAAADQLFRDLFPLLPALVAQAASEPMLHRFATAPVANVASVIEAQYLVEKVQTIALIEWFNAILAAFACGCGLANTAAQRRQGIAGAYLLRGNAKQDVQGYGPAAAIGDHNIAIALMEALRDELGEGWPLPWRNNLAGAYTNRGNAKQDAPGFDVADAIADCDAGIKLGEALRHHLGKDCPDFWRYDLAAAYMNRGNAKRKHIDFGADAAIADHDVAIALMEELSNELSDHWPSNWCNTLASAYMNRGNAKLSAHSFGPEGAIPDYDEAIALMEALRIDSGEDWPASWRNDLAGVYVNRGAAKLDAPSFGPSAAIADYDEAIPLMESLRDELSESWPVPWRNGLAAAYVNRGNAKRSVTSFGPEGAIPDYSNAIALREALREIMGEGWPLQWRSALAMTYIHRGTAKHEAPGCGPSAAIADYDEAIALIDFLTDTPRNSLSFTLHNSLANAYMGRGAAKQDALGFGPGIAIADYDEAIARMEALDEISGDAWPVLWRNLANAFMKRGSAKHYDPGFGHDEVAADFGAAIALGQAARATLGDAWPLPWRNDLANAYVSRGDVARSTPDFGLRAAIPDYDAAIELGRALRESMGEGWPLRWRNDLAHAYMNRGNAKQSAPGFRPDAAIADYDAAIALMEPLRDALGENWPLPWRKELSQAYMNRGAAKHGAPSFGPDAAIADYDKAIALMEGLRNALLEGWTVQWRSDLAGAYMNRGSAKSLAAKDGALRRMWGRLLSGKGRPAVHSSSAAIADHDSAIEIWNALQADLGDQFPPAWDHWLKRTCAERDRLAANAVT